jgi:hypothetical protein
MDKIMDKIRNAEVENLFSLKERQRGVQKYAEILQSFSKVNVETDREFQKKFNGFYRVRRNVQWQNVYYGIMEKGKTQPLSFEIVLRELYQKTGRVEASFASKLIHTLNNDMPIWDKFVLQNLEKKILACNGEKKIEYSIRIYEEIIAWYKEAFQTSEIKQKLLDFNQVFPEYVCFSQTKKLDFLLWQMR